MHNKRIDKERAIVTRQCLRESQQNNQNTEKQTRETQLEGEKENDPRSKCSTRYKKLMEASRPTQVKVYLTIFVQRLPT